MRRTLKRSEIVRGRKVFQEAFARGRKVEGRILRCFMLREDSRQAGGGPQVKFGVAVSRRLKKAVHRNRVKRMVRETYRLNKHILLPFVERGPGATDLIFLCSFAGTTTRRLPSFKEIEADMIDLLGTIVQSDWSVAE